MWISLESLFESVVFGLWPFSISYTLFWTSTVCWAWIFLPELTNYMSGEKTTLVVLTGREYNSKQCYAEKRKKTGKQREYRLCVLHRWLRPQFGCHGSNPEFCDRAYTYKQQQIKKKIFLFTFLWHGNWCIFLFVLTCDYKNKYAQHGNLQLYFVIWELFL